MKIGIPKEVGDHRVAIVPEVAKKIKALGAELIIEKSAGENASFPDELYHEFASVVDRNTLLQQSDLLISINPLPEAELDQLAKGTTLISLFQPYVDDTIAAKLTNKGFRAFSMDMIPRTTLAQSMDVLSSMASLAGYRAVLVAAMELPRYFPMMITAAGSIRPAKVLVLGAGVAGLQAIATAKRLGAMVEAFDVRAAAKEEVESLGAKFIEVEGAKDDTEAGGYAVEQSEDFLRRQREEVKRRAERSDVIITTAQVRGRKAPILVTTDTVEHMKPGSVIVDLAASTGGNCEVTKDNETYQYKGVTIVGNSNLPGGMAQDASLLFANNVLNFLKLFVKEGEMDLDWNHEIIRSSCITPVPEAVEE
jgi:NAD(P) transhydrogenase subunit alpha